MPECTSTGCRRERYAFVAFFRHCSSAVSMGGAKNGENRVCIPPPQSSFAAAAPGLCELYSLDLRRRFVMCTVLFIPGILEAKNMIQKYKGDTQNILIHINN